VPPPAALALALTILHAEPEHLRQPEFLRNNQSSIPADLALAQNLRTLAYRKTNR
jgi:hypothetical protein